MDGRQPPHRRLLHGRGEDARDAAAVAAAGNDTRIVSIDVATGATTDVPAGPGVKFNPSVLVGGRVGYIRKDGDDAGIYYSERRHADRQGQVRAASWSPDGSRVVFHRRQAAPPTWWKNTWSRNAEFEMALTSIMPSFGRDGERFVVDRPAAGRSDPRIEHRDRHAWIERRESRLSGSDAQRAGTAVGAERREDHLCRRRVQCVLQRVQQPVSEARAIAPRAARRSRSSIPTAPGFAS